jgi:hypothetical protein
MAVLDRHWESLVAAAWEDVCRQRMPWCSHPELGTPGTWSRAGRWWKGNAPEWDLVAEDADGKRLLLGEAKLDSRQLRALVTEVSTRQTPDLPTKYRRHSVVRAVFVPDDPGKTEMDGVAIASLRHLLTREIP